MPKQYLKITFFLKSGNTTSLSFEAEPEKVTHENFVQSVKNFEEAFKKGTEDSRLVINLEGVFVPDVENVELIKYEMVTPH